MTKINLHKSFTHITCMHIIHTLNLSQSNCRQFIKCDMWIDTVFKDYDLKMNSMIIPL